MKNWLLCKCGERFTGTAQFFAHRDSGTCPFNAPSGSGAFAHWSLRVRALTAAERAKKEEAAVRIAEMKANPEYQANALKKKEERKALKLAVRRFSVRGRK
jgi:hypothetical protein